MPTCDNSKYIALEGVDGCGKSTQVKYLAERLGAVQTREPGGTNFGRKVRSLMLDPESVAVPRAELLLVNSDRIQLLEELVVPALKSGRHVVSDRCYLSSLAYQGYGSGLPLEFVRDACKLGVDGHYPDRIIVLDLEIEEVEKRRASDKSGRLDRFEVEARAFRERVILGYKREAATDPDRVTLVNGSGSKTEVQNRIWAQVEPLLT